MAACRVAAKTEFLGQGLAGAVAPSSSNVTRTVKVSAVLKKAKKAAAPAKKAAQKAVSKVNVSSNEELAKWYGEYWVTHIQLGSGFLDFTRNADFTGFCNVSWF